MSEPDVTQPATNLIQGMDSPAAYLAVWLVGVLLAAVAVLVLWNSTMPRIFPGRVRALSYGESLRLMLLAWLLFGAGAFGLTYALGLGAW